MLFSFRLKGDCGRKSRQNRAFFTPVRITRGMYEMIYSSDIFVLSNLWYTFGEGPPDALGD